MNRIFHFIAVTLTLPALGIILSSCASTKEPEPPTERLSSMPHNMPASWEGQAGMGGMMANQPY